MAPTELRTTPLDPAMQNRLALAGVPWKLAITLWLIGLFALAVLYQLAGAWHWWGAALLLVFHLALSAVYSLDSCLFLNIGRYWRQAALYDPWPHRRVKRNPRPEGFGRDGLC